MRRIILFLVFSILGSTTFAQNKEEAEKLVDEGIAYHDKGDFEGAINKYNQALQLDKDNLLALAEKALTMVSLHKYEEAIENCQKVLDLYPGNKHLRGVYVTYGNAYDALNKTDKSLEKYEEGIKLFPGYYQLHFNKGITLASVRKYDEAILCFQQSASLNPNHASSQNALGRLLKATDKKVPSLLAFCRFLVLEPQSKRANENLDLLQGIIKANVEKTGENSISINFNPGLPGDTTADGKPKENNFSTTELILSLSAALDHDKKNSSKTEVEKFSEKIETICASLKETKGRNHGFYWEYYVPYFVEMYDRKFIETFSYIAFATSENPDIEKWLQNNKKDIDKFYEWSGSFWKAK